MRVALVLLLTLTMAGCGVHVSTDPVKVDPIQVNHTVTVNAQQLAAFYTAYCEGVYATQEEIDQCVTDSLANFWLAIEQSTPNGQVQQTGGTTE